MTKSLASKSGDRPDVKPGHVFSIGIANLAVSCLAAMPASGSLTRSALNYTSGARTPFSSIFCGLLCLGATILLAIYPIVSLIPEGGAGGTGHRDCAFPDFTQEHSRLPALHPVGCRRSAGDLFSPLCSLPFTSPSSSEWRLSIALFLRKAAVPQMIEYAVHDDGDLRELGEKRPRPNPEISIVHVEGDLFFGASELFRSQIQRIGADDNLKVIILRLKNARHLDATSVLALADLIKFMRERDRHVLISGTPRPVYRVLKNSGVLELLQEGTSKEEGTSNLFMYGSANPNISTRHALIRAQQLLGTKEADISIFHDANKDK